MYLQCKTKKYPHRLFLLVMILLLSIESTYGWTRVQYYSIFADFLNQNTNQYLVGYQSSTTRVLQYDYGFHWDSNRIVNKESKTTLSMYRPLDQTSPLLFKAMQTNLKLDISIYQNAAGANSGAYSCDKSDYDPNQCSANNYYKKTVFASSQILGIRRVFEKNTLCDDPKTGYESPCELEKITVVYSNATEYIVKSGSNGYTVVSFTMLSSDTVRIIDFTRWYIPIMIIIVLKIMF